MESSTQALIARILLLGAVLFPPTTLVGCGASKSPSESVERDRTAVAILHGRGVAFQRINGTDFYSQSASMEISPGPTTVSFRLLTPARHQAGLPSPVLDLVLLAHPGEEYVIMDRRDEAARICAWKVSPESGEPDLRHPVGCISNH